MGRAGRRHKQEQLRKAAKEVTSLILELVRIPLLAGDGRQEACSRLLRRAASAGGRGGAGCQ